VSADSTHTQTDKVTDSTAHPIHASAVVAWVTTCS